MHPPCKAPASPPSTPACPSSTLPLHFPSQSRKWQEEEEGVGCRGACLSCRRPPTRLLAWWVGWSWARGLPAPGSPGPKGNGMPFASRQEALLEQGVQDLGLGASPCPGCKTWAGWLVAGPLQGGACPAVGRPEHRSVSLAGPGRTPRRHGAPGGEGECGYSCVAQPGTPAGVGASGLGCSSLLTGGFSLLLQGPRGKPGLPGMPGSDGPPVSPAPPRLSPERALRTRSSPAPPGA